MADSKGRYTADDSIQAKVDSIVTEQMELILNKMISNIKKELNNLRNESSRSIQEVYADMDKFELQSNNKRIDMFARSTAAQKKIVDAQSKFEQKLFEKANAQERVALLKNQNKRIQSFQEEYRAQENLQLKLEAEKEQWRLNYAKRAAETRKATSEEEAEAIRARHQAHRKSPYPVKESLCFIFSRALSPS